MSRSTLLIVMLAIAALGSWYLARQGNLDHESTTVVETTQRGYYLKSARMLGTGPDGALLYEIQARHAEQREDNRISFTDVKVSYSPASAVPWSVDADTALIDPAQPVVQLSGHVIATSTEGFSGDDTEIRTQYLELDPENYLAETDDRVQIRIGTRSLTATGMLASLKDQKVQLKSNVNGKFAP
ncbi:MAG: LPS export ABC transporter periplasmic protein LptC [Pseudomonadota bacterium]